MAGSGPKAPFAPLAARFRQNVLFRAFCSFPCFLQYTANLFFSQANVRKQIRLICHGRRFLPQGNRASDQNPCAGLAGILCSFPAALCTEHRAFFWRNCANFGHCAQVFSRFLSRCELTCFARYDMIFIYHCPMPKGAPGGAGTNPGERFVRPGRAARLLTKAGLIDVSAGI